MNKKINLGIIGLSEGNGHPYSWSAIFNGYDKKKMESCGYPTIPIYLKEQKFPDAQIKEGKVTHVWTQDLNLSKHIAAAALIENIATDYNELVENVDAVLLARDDAENHFEFAKPFLKAGMPIYIDKPLATTVDGAKKIINLQRYEGQLFSCSALRYAPELKLSDEKKKILGEIRSIHGYVQKSWEKYAVHIIEPILQLIPNRGEIENSMTQRSDDKVSLSVNFKSGIDVQIETFGKHKIPTGLKIIGTKGSITVNFNSTFETFRSALKNFIEGIINKDVRISSKDMIEVVRLIELGKKKA
jgi:predicted dehydrogenase